MNVNFINKMEGGKLIPKVNPRARANFFSKFMFLWTFPFLRKGLSHQITIGDICQPMDSDQAELLGRRLEKNWFAEITRAKEKRQKPSLLRALFKTFISEYILDGFLRFTQQMICRSCQPILLASLIDYFETGSTVTREEAFIYASGIVILSGLYAFAQHHCIFRALSLGMRIRVACCNLIYRKMLRLNSKSLGQTTAGQIVNLLSNDVSRFDQVLLFLHLLWIMPFQIAVLCYLLYTSVGTSALIGVACIMLQTLPVQSYLSKVTADLRRKVAIRTDERVRVMSEIISGIQVIKMYAWEKPFEKIVSKVRGHELSKIKKASFVFGAYISLMVFTERFTLFVTLLAYSLLGFPVTASTVFSMAQYYNTLQTMFSLFYPRALSGGAECLVTISRLRKFLMLEEREDLREPRDDNKHLETYRKYNYDMYNLDDFGQHNMGFECTEENLLAPVVEDPSIKIDNVTASWVRGQITLDRISMEVPRGKLCAIIGAVGSGKSSILQLLLKELAPSVGVVAVNGEISYASQEPWLFVASVKNNILFGLPYDNQRYKEVVRVCALEKDFQQLPHGDQTLVGERGASLSGGQRARINLARTVYRKVDVYLLDDPLSAVDAHVGRHLYSECIMQFLKEKTVILVTHQLHYLKTADLIVTLKNGSIENVGTYSELASSVEEVARELSTTLDRDRGEHAEKSRLRRRTSSSSSSQRSSNAEEIDEKSTEEETPAAEEQVAGRMRREVYLHYWRAVGSWPLVALMITVTITGQIATSLCDYWVTYWTNQESLQSAKDVANLTAEYKYDAEFNIYDKIGRFTTVEYLCIHSVVIVLCVTLVVGRAMLFFYVCIRASKGLHDQMFHNILRGVMRFFDTNPSGRILNRFSKDIGAIDEILPRAMVEAGQILLVMMSVLVLVSITNPWLLLPILVLLGLFYAMFRIYLSTAQDVKRLEGICVSPIFSHITSSLSGITTIRSSGANEKMANEFAVHQNLHTSAWYQALSCAVALGFWLDVVCLLFLTVVTFSFIIFETGNTLTGNVGLAITQALALLGMLQFGVRQTAEIVSQMTSVERILQYNRIEAEHGLEKGEKKIPLNWPHKGEIVFDRTYLKYSDLNPHVLKNLNIIIKHSWKVGIVGRTGAGKSSLISALFRLAKVSGGIIIDNVDSSRIALQDLRSRISIIPQEPVLFMATVRYNLDPFGKYDDAALWSALESVELKSAVSSLDLVVQEGGSNFSVGQRQLVCLARTLLSSNKILIMDEATANVDPQTDALIQKTIREKFAHCTVLTIAHRLNTVMDSDRVLVMESGKSVEYDHPYVLLGNCNGHLYRMVQETGVDMAGKLHQAAYEAYAKSRSTGGVRRRQQSIAEEDTT